MVRIELVLVMFKVSTVVIINNINFIICFFLNVLGLSNDRILSLKSSLFPQILIWLKYCNLQKVFLVVY